MPGLVSPYNGVGMSELSTGRFVKDMSRKYIFPLCLPLFLLVVLFYTAYAWTPLAVEADPLVRMPGTQPAQRVSLEAPRRCMNCHEGYNQAVEPGFNWKGSMMAQSARDPLFWAAMTVAAQDSFWAIGTPNAADLCLRCHFPEGWLGGRSDPVNASRMTGSDFDGIHCDFCHTMYDPFYKDTYLGIREGNDWKGYWDEATSLSQTEAGKTYAEDKKQASTITFFSGAPFFQNDRPVHSSYIENGGGQYFVSTGSEKRAGFADAEARHKMLYSRYHKSKYFCATCHDVSNPVLANLNAPDGQPLPSEVRSAFEYYHVERTFSEFMLSAYGRNGAATNLEFRAQGASDITYVDKCQDCHMRDVKGAGADKNSSVFRPDGSKEHPRSGQPLHDLTGGNAWMSYILASLDPNGPVYDPRNVQILDKGPSVLTLDLNAGQSPKNNGHALKAGSDRARQQLESAGTIIDLVLENGTLDFKVLNNTGHKLISGFPEGRRMFINIKAFKEGTLAYEINPYDYQFGTLKGLPGAPAGYPALSDKEAYRDELVYEVKVSSSLTGENNTFHFVLADGRYKDNRIPPKGFDIANAAKRLSEPVQNGVSAPGLFSGAEYAGGYHQVSLPLPVESDYVEVNLYYQGTTREYIEFLRDQINGDADTLLRRPAPSGLTSNPYLIQTDPFFARLKAWGNTIWDLWEHNHFNNKVPGILPLLMTSASAGTPGEPPQPPPPPNGDEPVVPPPSECVAPAVPQNLTATGAKRRIDLVWNQVEDADGYRIYYYQAGKMQYVDTVGADKTSYFENKLSRGTTYTYVITAYSTCNGQIHESGPSNPATATAQ